MENTDFVVCSLLSGPAVRGTDAPSGRHHPVHPDQTAAGTGGRRFPAADGLSGGAATGRVYPDRAGTELRTGSGADAGLE